jgi:hypothetical protein
MLLLPIHHSSMIQTAASTSQAAALLRPAPGWLTAAFLLVPIAIWASLVVAAALILGLTALLAIVGGYLALIGVLAASPNGRRGMQGSRSTQLDGKRSPEGEGAAS